MREKWIDRYAFISLKVSFFVIVIFSISNFIYLILIYSNLLLTT